MNRGNVRGFDRVAFFYDGLARLVFGRSIVLAQTHFLSAIPDRSNVLMLGGGTGWILTSLLKKKSNCCIWYIEASKKMLDYACKRISDEASVHFIHGTEENIPSDVKFNVVITHFYLDLFGRQSLEKVAQKITGMLDQHGQWIASDFVNNGKWWQRLFLWMMYRFFRIVCDIEAAALPPWESVLNNYLQTCNAKHFYYEFIKSSVYVRKGI